MADLFSDGFESGLTAWSSAVTDEGKLSATEAAALNGSWGLSVLIDDTTGKYVIDDTPSNETRYRVRFYFDPNDLTMLANKNFRIFWGQNDSSGLAFNVTLKYISGNYTIRMYDGTVPAWGDPYIITNEPHYIEVDWSAGNGDGFLSLWIDGVWKETLANLDNDGAEVDTVRLGANFIPNGVSGTFFLDDFASNNDGSEIGEVGEVDPDLINGYFMQNGAKEEKFGYYMNTIEEFGYYMNTYTTKWSGLGMGVYDIDVVSEYEEYIDDLVAYGFTKMKIFPPKYYGASEIAASKIAVLYAVSKGIDVTWGYCSGPDIITATSWIDYRAGILEAAQWAQDNGVFEFRLGNEDLAHVDGTTKTAAQLLIDFKSVATDAQAIFTNGNIAYSCRSDFIDDFIAAGKGDIDILSANVYMGGGGNYDDNWMNLIDDLINAFGVDGTYLTEFAPSWDSLDDYSTDESVQATAVTEMIEYIKASGMKRALYFCYANPYWFADNRFGALKVNGEYRLLWNSLLNSG